MGGKHKQAQRTKNNTRPSSSGRSAALLGTPSQPFAGFAVARESGYTSALPGFLPGNSDNVDNIDSIFQLVLKKMNKKDPITKLKALQEFTELIQSSEENAVKAVLPFWPRLYTHLAVDAEHRVREAAHVAHRAVVLKVRRNIAPYLRQLAGPWFTALYDTYPPAASAAALSFNDAFPPEKVSSAIVFCQEEILNYITENLTSQIPQTISNAGTLSPVELEAKFERLLVSSLLGYSFYLDKVPKENLLSARAANCSLINNKKYWKLSSHSSSLVRSSWFSALISICVKAPEFLSENLQQVASIVFGKLDDPDPVVLPKVWEAVLHVLTTIPNCWSYISAEKLVFPKLWRILQEGGQGNASTIFPNLLPFLSKLPPNVIYDRGTFYNRYFSSILEGLSKKTVYQCNSECQSIVMTYTECIQYLSNLHQQEEELCSMLSNFVFVLVEKTISVRKFPVMFVFRGLSTLIRYWRSNGQIPIFDKLSKTFWHKLQVLFKDTLVSNKISQESEETGKFVVENLVCLCLVLKTPNIAKVKRNLEVKFQLEDSKSEAESSVINDSSESLKSLEDANEEFNCDFISDLKSVVHLLSSYIFNEVTHNKTAEVLPLLVKLTKAFNSKELFLEFGESISITTVQELYEKIFHTWLVQSTVCSEHVVELIFLLLQNLSDEEKLPILQLLSTISEGKPLSWIFKWAAIQQDAFIHQWLSSPQMNSILTKLAAIFCGNGGEESVECVLLQCILPAYSGDLIISTEALSGILLIFKNHINTVNGHGKRFISKFLLQAMVGEKIRCHVIKISYTVDLLREFFKMNCYKSCSEEIQLAWQRGVSVIFKIHGFESNEFKSFVTSCSEILTSYLLERSDSACDRRISDIVEMVINFVMACTEPSENWSPEEFNYFVFTLTKMLLSVTSLKIVELYETALPLCFYANLLNGVLSKIKPDIVSDTLNVYSLVTLSLHMIDCICKISDIVVHKYLGTIDGLESDSVGKYSSLNCIEKFENEYLLSLVPRVICNNFLKNFKNHVQYFPVSRKMESLNESLTSLLKRLNDEDIRKLKNLLINRSFKDGGIWCEVLCQFQEELSLCYSDIVPDTENDSTETILAIQIYIDKVEECEFEMISKYKAFSTLPVLSSYISKCKIPVTEDVKPVLRTLINSIISSDEDNSDMLFGCEIPDADWEKISNVVDKINLLSATVKKLPKILTLEDWDFLFRALVYWLQTVDKSIYCMIQERQEIPISVAIFAAAAFTLFLRLKYFFENLCSEFDFKDMEIGDVPSEWTDVVCDHVNLSLISILYTFSDMNFQQTQKLQHMLLLEKFDDIMAVAPIEHYFSNFDPQGVELQKLVSLCFKLIYSPTKPLQRLSYHILKSLLPVLAKNDSKLEIVENNEEKYQQNLWMWKLLRIATEAEGVVNTLLMDFNFGDACIIQPHTDSYTYTIAYLLLWSLVLDICGQAVSELRYQYASILRNSDYLKNLMKNLFCLMPEETLLVAEAKTKHHKIHHYFAGPPNLNSNSESSSDVIQHFACWVYYNLLKRLPALFRQWWVECDPKISMPVERITVCFVSPRLCGEELSAVQLQKRSKNIQIKVHVSSREVIAAYSVDEAQMELIIQLPVNHPLGAIKVECAKTFVGSNQWRNWMMQLTIFLSHQNGSLWDGLILWKNNLDKHFEGVEECYICFSVLHGSNYQIPKLCCKTCKKKFHSPCLYKWFSTSNKSTCPICRNIF